MQHGVSHGAARGCLRMWCDRWGVLGGAPDLRVVRPEEAAPVSAVAEVADDVGLLKKQAELERSSCCTSVTALPFPLRRRAGRGPRRQGQRRSGSKGHILNDFEGG